MSGVNIIWALLKGNAAVIAQVPVTRIKSGTLPENIALPAIAVSKISGVDRNIIKQGATVYVTHRVQVSVLAANYTDAQTILKLVRAACREQRGTIAGFDASVLTDGEGPDDIYGELTGIYLQTQDFKVMFSEAP